MACLKPVKPTFLRFLTMVSLYTFLEKVIKSFGVQVQVKSIRDCTMHLEFSGRLRLRQLKLIKTRAMTKHVPKP